MQQLSILGSTGSIGTQALEMVARHRDRFSVTALTAHRNASLLFEQVRTFRPKMAGLTVPIPLSDIPEDLRFCDWYFGQEALLVAAGEVPADSVLVSIVGMAGLAGVMTALEKKRRVLLANKEALVAGGQLVMEAAKQAGQPLIPVDSEHSAIFQCLEGAQGNAPASLWLTASGGPFRTWAKEEIASATREDALRHPNWAMGAKITIDSASMFNKALEIVEARWLFQMPPERIKVLVHPQSIIHSAVEFDDGAVIAQMSVPSMHLPILYAMTYPKRLPTGDKPLNLFDISSLTFEKEDPIRFPALSIVRECLAIGGAACCVMNAANEIAVEAFLQDKITFGAIPHIVTDTLSTLGSLPANTLPDIIEADRLARNAAQAAQHAYLR